MPGKRTEKQRDRFKVDAKMRTIAEPVRDRQTRDPKTGRITTSKARLRRIAMGLEKPAKPAQPARATIPKIRDMLPEMPEEGHQALYRLARYVPGVVSELGTRRKSVIRQQLARASAVETISLATPDAAHYLHRLVKGEYTDGEQPAPHAVRRQAAVDLLTLGRIEQQHQEDARDLQEMTPQEIQAQLAQIDAEIAALRSKPQDVVSGAAKHGEIPHETQDAVSAPA